MGSPKFPSINSIYQSVNKQGFLDERPEKANKRERIEDWEADMIIGKNHNSAIVTLDERKSK